MTSALSHADYVAMLTKADAEAARARKALAALLEAADACAAGKGCDMAALLAYARAEKDARALLEEHGHG